MGEKINDVYVDSQRAAMWVPLGDALACYQCRQEFSKLKLNQDKHHCRKCG